MPPTTYTLKCMQDLIRELIPHAPQMGLYLAPGIPKEKLQGALGDYAKNTDRDDVLALYDATLMGSAKDGAVFTAEGFVFENNDLEAAQGVRYADVVRVETKKKFLGGRRVNVDVNRGRSTFQLSMDFSGKPEAAEYVARFLQEAMLRGGRETGEPAQTPLAQTDVEAVEAALRTLRAEGKLAAADLQRLLDALHAG